MWTTHGPYVALAIALLLGGVGLPIPEEVVLLSAGTLAHRHVVSLPLVALVTGLAVLLSDQMLFHLGRRFGPAALSHAPLRWILPPARRARVEALFNRRGPTMVFLARFVPGLRGPTFLTAGLHGMPTLRFLAIDLVAVSVSLPLDLGLGYFASASVDRIQHDLAHAEHWIALGLAIALALWALSSLLRRYTRGMRTLLLALLLVLGATSCGSSDSCKGACDHLKSCGLKSSGFSCDTGCSDQAERDCAECLNGTACDRIAAGDCAQACPGATFTN